MPKPEVVVIGRDKKMISIDPSNPFQAKRFFLYTEDAGPDREKANQLAFMNGKPVDTFSDQTALTIANGTASDLYYSRLFNKVKPVRLIRVIYEVEEITPDNVQD
jgi:hypothetical protein